jgi:hypothetical protein
MFVIWLLPGLALPALIGWLVLDLLEGKTRVLHDGEKFALSLALGMTFAMLVMFFAERTVGVPFTIEGFIGVFSVLLIALAIPWFLRKGKRESPHSLAHAHPVKSWVTVWLLAGSAWVAVRVIIFGLVTLVTPSYFDDTMDNWNMRAKLFFYNHHFTIAYPWDPNPGVSSYPPTVPLAKTWLSALNGAWNEGLVNSLHVVWFVALLALLYYTLRRMLPWTWSLLGTVTLASLPLELIQGTSAYADVFLSLHIFAAVSLLFSALRAEDRQQVQTWLRLAAFAIALLPFTKNEGWGLYFPVLVLLYCGTVWVKKQNLLRAGLTLAVLALLLVTL